MIDKMSDTSRLVDRLQAKDLVYKKQCDNDGRKIRVFITEKGLNLLTELDAIEEAQPLTAPVIHHLRTAMQEIDFTEFGRTLTLLERFHR